jgi:hypothetical protein
MDHQDTAPLIECDLAVGRSIVAAAYLLSETLVRSLPAAATDERRVAHFAHLRSYLQTVFGAWPVHVLESTLGEARNDRGECQVPRLQVAAKFVSWPPGDPSTIEYLVVVWYQEDQHPLVAAPVAAELRQLDWCRLAEACDY